MSLTRCTRCVMPQTRPDTPFENGVCSACLAYDRRSAIDWEARVMDLRALIERAKYGATMNGRAYDCIVASSGGKDSTYQVMTLLGLRARVLAVTATTCHLTGMGRHNLDNLARHVDTIEVSPNRQVRAKLNRIGLETVGDPSWPEHAAIFTTPWRIAKSLDIPLIFYGESPQNQYGGPPGTEEERRMTGRWMAEHGGLLGLRASDMVERGGLAPQDLDPYRMPEDVAGIDAYFLGQFIPWDSHRNARVAIAAGLVHGRPTQANWWTWENLDNAQTGLHDHLMYRKYGFGRGTSQLAVDVRTGRVTRDEALAWIRENDGLFPYYYAGVHWTGMLARMGLTPAELDLILDRFTNWALFAGEDNRRPILKD